MRCCGVKYIRIETAGASGPESRPEATLMAVKDAIKVRDEIMLRRDQAVFGGNNGQSSFVGAGIINQQPGKIVEMDLGRAGLAELVEIKNSLMRIEGIPKNSFC